jgi:hypothetical protein
MIEIITLDRTPAGQFDDFNDLFDCIITIENLKLVAKPPNTKQMNWSFAIHPPKRAAALYTHGDSPSEAIEEAYEEQLPLIEICAGDYKHPLYIVLTPNVAIDYLRKKWCLDWCTWHHLVLREV